MQDDEYKRLDLAAVEVVFNIGQVDLLITINVVVDYALTCIITKRMCTTSNDPG